MNDVRKTVRDEYGKIAVAASEVSCCTASRGADDAASAASCGCGSSDKLGYGAQELAALPAGGDLGLGCGNPQAIAALQPGETVLDLGSGAGIDCFLAARQVGPAGKVIGVDMTAEMVDKARANAAEAGAANVEFRLGEIEHLPVADAAVDVIMSNCVINLSPDKPAVFRESFRVLKPGGRLAISDIVATAPLPAAVRDSIELHVGCMAGAALIDELRSMLTEVGFIDIRIEPDERTREIIGEYAGGLANCLVSATIEAVRP